MKNKILLIFFLLFLFSPLKVNSQEPVTLHLFYSNTCRHCENEIKFLNKLVKKHSNLIVKKYEITTSDENDKLLDKVKLAFDDDTPYIPYTVIGSYKFIGYNKDVGNKIEKVVKHLSEVNYQDIVSEIIEGKFTGNVDELKLDETKFKIPVLGEIDPTNISLPLVTIAIAVVDGFNPCAMWVLIFLLSILIGMKNKKKMIALGLTFLITSAIIYLLFMVAWLKIIVTTSTILWIRTVIALAALTGGLFSLKSYFKQRKQEDGCDVVNLKQKQSIISKITKFTMEKSFVLSMIGIITLAISVNVIELACSAGLPLVYTQILALNNLSTTQYMLYMLLYILFFLIDDIIVFLIAIKTFEVTGISTKYTKYSHLIGGIIMLLIGLLLLINPQLLSF